MAKGSGGTWGRPAWIRRRWERKNWWIEGFARLLAILSPIPVVTIVIANWFRGTDWQPVFELPAWVHLATGTTIVGLSALLMAVWPKELDWQLGWRRLTRDLVELILHLLAGTVLAVAVFGMSWSADALYYQLPWPLLGWASGFLLGVALMTRKLLYVK